MNSKSIYRAIVWGLACLALMVSSCYLPAGKRKTVEVEPGAGKAERTPVYKHGGWIIARASLHSHTNVSDGCRTPEDLLELARIQGMAVLSYNDHREAKECAGKSELFCQRKGNIEGTIGYKEYFEILDGLQEKARGMDMIVLKGTEARPYIYNYGKFPHLVINGGQNHFTVNDIDEPEILEGMPGRDYITFKPHPLIAAEPYNEFVDYVVANGGIVSAAHIDSGNDEWVGMAHGAQPAPADNIHRLDNLTAFAVLPEGWGEKSGGPGGWWDTVLMEYLGGMRKVPVWAWGDSDYHCRRSLAGATTLFYMREFTEEEVYRCMREGRMVALMGDSFQDTYVAQWAVSGSGKPSGKVMLGQEVKVKGAPVIRFALNRAVPGCRTRLIKNGKVIFEGEGTEISYIDREQGKREEPAYYRVEVVGPRLDPETYDGPTHPESELFVNPIFVRFTK